MRLVVCLLLALTVSGKADPIRLELTPRSGFAPLTVRAKVTIEPNDHNRAFCLDWDSEAGEGGRTCRTIDGSSAAKVYWFYIDLKSGGEYAFQAFVAQGSKWEQTTPTQVTVVSRY